WSEGEIVDMTLSQEADAEWGTTTAAAPPSFAAGSTDLIIGTESPQITAAPGEAAEVDVAVQTFGDGSDAVDVRVMDPEGHEIGARTMSLDEFGRAHGSLAIDIPTDSTEGYSALTVSATGTGSPATMPVSIRITRPG